MEFYVNSHRLDITIEDEKTVGDVLRAFETEFGRNGATTVGIVLNGRKVGADEFDAAEAEPLSEDTRLELSVVSAADVRQTLSDIAGASRAISEKLADLPADFQSGRDKEANLLIATLAELVDRFCVAAKYASLFPNDFKTLLAGIDGRPPAEFFRDLAPVLSDFEQAISSGDTVLLGDLAEYEIRPRLTAIADAIDGSVNA